MTSVTPVTRAAGHLAHAVGRGYTAQLADAASGSHGGCPAHLARTAPGVCTAQCAKVGLGEGTGSMGGTASIGGTGSMGGTASVGDVAPVVRWGLGSWHGDGGFGVGWYSSFVVAGWFGVGWCTVLQLPVVLVLDGIQVL